MHYSVGWGVLVVLIAASVRAELFSWTGGLTLDLAQVSSLSATGSGLASVGPGDGGLPALASISLDAGSLTLATTQTIPGFPSPIAIEWDLAAGVGGFATDGPSFGGVLPLRGSARYSVLTTFFSPLTVPLTLNATRGLGMATGAIEVTATAYVPPPLGSGTTTLTARLEGAPWTLGSTTVRHAVGPSTETTSTRTGFAHGPLSATSLAGVAQADGVLQLVTPVRIQEPSISHLFDQSGFATLELRLVPEPGPFAALASGAALAGVLGAARRRRRTGPQPVGIGFATASRSRRSRPEVERSRAAPDKQA